MLGSLPIYASRTSASALLAALALCPVRGAAQGPVPNFSVQWRWVMFDADDGIPSGKPVDVVEKGDVTWLWSEGGLAWYDGYVWTRVEEFAERRIAYVCSGAGSRLLVVVEGRVYVGDASGFDEVPLPEFEPGFRVRRAVPHPEDGLLVSITAGTTSARLVHVTDSGNVDELGVIHADGLWRTRAGTVWASFLDGTRRWEAGGWAAAGGDDAGLPEVTRVVESTGGAGFLTRSHLDGRNGLFTWGPGGATTHWPEEGSNRLIDGDVAADGSFGLFLWESGDLRSFADGTFDELRSIPQEHRDGATMIRISEATEPQDIWIGSPGTLHLYRWSNQRWSGIRRPFPDLRNRVHAIAVTEEGQLWQATAGGIGIQRLTGRTDWHTRILDRDVSNPTTLHSAADGAVWVGSGATFDGVLRFRDGVWEHLGPDDGLDAGRVHRIVGGADDSIWLAGLGPHGGVHRWTPDGGFEAWSETVGLEPGSTYDVLDLGDQVWVARQHGLYRVRGRTVDVWSRDELPIHDEAALGYFALVRRPDGRVWVAGHPRGVGGLGWVDDGDEIRWITLPGGEDAQMVWSLSVDANGYLWAGTSGGAVVLRDGNWSLIGYGAGIDAAGVWPILPRSEDVLLGTAGGGIRALSRAEESELPPRVVLREATHSNGLTRVRWQAHAWWGSVASAAIETRYRLDEGPWSEWSTQREVEFDELSSGRHTIEVQAKGLFGQVAEEPTPATIAVPLPLLLRPVYAIPFGTLLGILLVVIAQTNRRRREQARALAESEQRLRFLVDSAPEALALYDLKRGVLVDANENAEQFFGRRRGRLIGSRPSDFAPAVLPDGRVAAEVLSRQLRLAGAGNSVQFDWWIRQESGSLRECELFLRMLPSMDGEQLLRMSVVDKRDLARATRERQELETQLRQSQKLEAMGKLTGGIAHDFNNLLTVIRGNLELLQGEDGRLSEDESQLLDSALRATDQSAELTRRLLAFSRKQPLTPQVVEVPELLAEMTSLLRRTLGEHFEVVVSVAEDTRPVLVNRSSLENAILNLAINSRDAMGSHGQLLLEAGEVELRDVDVADLEGVEPGHFVCIVVTDTGSGMPPEIAERAFDPFFTTKEVGEGSGLGLSMVYGFARQAGGTARLSSEPERGTVVKLLLPATDDVSAPDAPPREEFRDSTPAAAPDERILIVEDDTAVRSLLERTLTDLGYDTVAREDAFSALDYLSGEEPIDLLLSDIVLPGGMHGVELGAEAREVRPDLRVLFVSGYAEESVLRIAGEDPDFDLLSKPFEREVLARRVREALDR